MRPWNRLDARVITVLLLSIFTPWVIAEDYPTRRPAAKSRTKIQRVNAEAEQPSEQAVQRWDQLKSRYSPAPETASGPARSSGSTTKRSKRKSGPVRPIPEDVPDELADDEELSEDAEWLDEEQVAEPRATVRPAKSTPVETVEEPLPVTEDDEEPAWIYGTTAEAVQTADEEKDKIGVVALQDDADSAAAEPIPPVQTGSDDTPAEAVPADPEYAPRPGSRRPRQIHDIRPTYDLNYDKDIREFAKDQARLYNVELRHGGPFPQRMFPGLMYQWEPSNFYHYPLYFEDPALERYGHTYPFCIQPAVSIARFSTQLIFLPYQMTIDPPCCPKYALGWYRPGECAPKLHYQVPLSAKAAAVQAGVVTGMFFAIP